MASLRDMHDVDSLERLRRRASTRRFIATVLTLAAAVFCGSARSFGDDYVTWAPRIWLAQALCSVGLLVMAWFTWRIVRIDDAIARAKSLQRMGVSNEPQVKVLGD